ncbi:hypothetical protein [Actinokineospora diospyrosa]|uniref:IrrE N-terminal-like domain-containing protein n=1 Tax=Actinokineospora diospyrosa TaxID=103728 RepID=A0ABT1IND7_9PSEU|nr:hypothetical protein [Actinokineospora diospyrosa]MCP2274172.1 hypothetical protein [Actinokineospora diospyrosa]
MRVEFQHDPRGESLTRVTRSDGIVLLLPSYSRKWRVPHDLAHAVTERELGIGTGVFGCIAAGAVFDNMTVASGRPKRTAKAHSSTLLKSVGRALNIAEIMAGTFHHFVEHNEPISTAAVRSAWGSMAESAFPWTDAEVAAAYRALRALDEQWTSTRDPLAFDWPERLRADRPQSSRVPLAVR